MADKHMSNVDAYQKRRYTLRERNGDRELPRDARAQQNGDDNGGGNGDGYPR